MDDHQAVESADYGVIGTEAHAIKSAAANLTADKLARPAADLEQAAQKQRLDLTRELADKLEMEFHCLKKMSKKIPNKPPHLGDLLHLDFCNPA